MADRALGQSLTDVCFSGDTQKIFDAYWSGLAVVTMSAALWELSAASRGQFSVAAGYSVGQFGAFFAAGVLDLESMIRLVAERGRCLKSASQIVETAMVAVIGLPLERVQSVVARHPHAVISNFNAPGNYSIGCLRTAAAVIVSDLEGAGAVKVVVLEVEGAWHSPHMKAAADEFRPILEKTPFHHPKLNIVDNVTGRFFAGTDAIVDQLYRHIYEPVLWQQSVLKLKEAGYTNYQEFSLRPQLATFIKFTDRSAKISTCALSS